MGRLSMIRPLFVLFFVSIYTNRARHSLGLEFGNRFDRLGNGLDFRGRAAVNGMISVIFARSSDDRDPSGTRGADMSTKEFGSVGLEVAGICVGLLKGRFHSIDWDRALQRQGSLVLPFDCGGPADGRGHRFDNSFCNSFGDGPGTARPATAAGRNGVSEGNTGERASLPSRVSRGRHELTSSPRCCTRNRRS